MREHTSGPDLESEKSFQASLLGLIGLGIKLYYESALEGFLVQDGRLRQSAVVFTSAHSQKWLCSPDTGAAHTYYLSPEPMNAPAYRTPRTTLDARRCLKKPAELSVVASAPSLTSQRPMTAARTPTYCGMHSWLDVLVIEYIIK